MRSNILQNPGIFLRRRLSFAGELAYFVTDYSVHTSKETSEYLTTMAGPFDFFTPEHGSWLHFVEGFFSKLTREMSEKSECLIKKERIERIYKYFAEINDSQIVCHWKYHMSEINPEEAVTSFRTSLHTKRE